MRVWNELPLLRLLISFVAGILASIFFPFRIEVAISGFIVVFIVLCLFTFIKKLYRKINLRWMYGVALSSTLFTLGTILTFIKTDKNDPRHFSNGNKGQIYIAVLSDQLHEKKSTFKTVVEIKEIQSKDRTRKKANGKVLVYFASDSLSAKLKYGDKIIFSSVPQDVGQPKNPEEFSYKRFLSFHNIYHQVYLASGKWIKLDGNEGNSLRKFGFDLRDNLVGIFKDKIIRKQEYGVASALVLGYEDNIDGELINAYASAGAMHILCVSGMHVGIIFLVFNAMLLWMNKNKWLRHLKFIILILFIWFYAMLTGFSPAVLRAAAMISFVIIGKWRNENVNIFNSFIVSVFALLLWNPFLLTEVGFQLSYLAVFGICYLHPLIAKWIEPSNWILRQVWQITSVSVSAQIMTFPLGLLYFHQFPLLFFISNLVVIPLSTVIIYVCILLLLFSWIPMVSAYLSAACFTLLHALNSSVLFTEQIPFSLIPGISISVFETWIIYLLMASLLFFFLYKRAAYLMLSLFLFIIILSGQVQESLLMNRQKKIIVYSIAKESAYDFVAGRTNYCMAQNSLLGDRSKMMFHIIHNRWALGIENTINIPDGKQDAKYENLFLENNFIDFYGKKIRVVKNEFNGKRLVDSKEKIKLDYLILTGENFRKVKDLQAYFDFKSVIIDSSNSIWKTEKLISECKALHINYYSVLHSGAFVEDI